ENISNVIKRARTITNYIYNHGWLLAKMREFCKGEIIRPATTRFATNYIALDSLLKKKSGLKQLFTSEDWANHNFSRSNAGRMVESIVLDHSFWTQSEHVCQVFEPLYKVLRIVDTEVYPTMGAIYELMRVVKEELEKKTWCKVAYYLNPRYQYRPGVGDDGTLIRAVHKVYSKLDPASPAVGQFGNELTWFKDARRTFGEPTSVAARTKMSPTEWWIMYGTDAPTVRKLAIKVLSQTTSSSACERNWSTFALIHTKQRNRLAHSRLEKLVYCYYNMKLQIRDKEAEIDHVDRGDPLDVFDIAAEDDDTE
ncbi:PREDICTED: LOW QUALITY PROTEIN, partial [Prunus dulcis]